MAFMGNIMAFMGNIMAFMGNIMAYKKKKSHENEIGFSERLCNIMAFMGNIMTVVLTSRHNKNKINL